MRYSLNINGYTLAKFVLITQHKPSDKQSKTIGHLQLETFEKNSSKMLYESKKQPTLIAVTLFFFTKAFRTRHLSKSSEEAENPVEAQREMKI